MLGNVLLVLDKHIADRLSGIGRAGPRCGTRSITSSTRWKRSRSFSTTMSKGVLVVPSSLPGAVISIGKVFHSC